MNAPTALQRWRIDHEVEDFARRAGIGIIEVDVRIAQCQDGLSLNLFHPGSGPDWSMLAAIVRPDGTFLGSPTLAEEIAATMDVADPVEDIEEANYYDQYEAGYDEADYRWSQR